ncbi:MAG: septum formation initiator family protein [Schleiferiaceae bacterium]|jgi:cell division protein FtsB|nr:septum formation initiator family protein [Schleiferiaceae bacterium]
MLKKLHSNIWFSRITNKYVLSSILFAVWMLFLDTHSILIQRDLSKEIDHLEQDIEFYETELETMRTELHELESNPKAFEKYAREKFWMHKPGEKIVLVELPEKE